MQSELPDPRAKGRRRPRRRIAGADRTASVGGVSNKSPERANNDSLRNRGVLKMQFLPENFNIVSGIRTRILIEGAVVLMA